MVPLGAMWGNDPGLNPEQNPAINLQENWINPSAPQYSTQTLGWGGRLSGPNDGATNDISVGGKVLINHRDSSCMSCHSPAQWQPVQHKRSPSFCRLFPTRFLVRPSNPARFLIPMDLISVLRLRLRPNGRDGSNPIQEPSLWTLTLDRLQRLRHGLCLQNIAYVVEGNRRILDPSDALYLANAQTRGKNPTEI